MDESVFYDFNELLTKNALINMVLSNRGAGKTYGFKKWAITDYLKTGAQFMYARRYREEFSTILTFFDDIRNKFPDHDFAVRGGKQGGRFLIDGNVAGYFAPVSSQLALKSSSFPEVNKVCYDEFLLEKGMLRYLPNECHAFFNFIETINRLRTSEKLHEQVRVFCFANTITLVNPYFQYFNIAMDVSKRYTVPPEYGGDVLVEVYKNKEFIEEKKKTRMGAIMAKTPYGTYAIDGDFFQDDGTFIKKHPKNIECDVEIRYNGKSVFFWYDEKNAAMYASYEKREGRIFSYSLTSSDHRPNYILIARANTNPFVRLILACFNNACLYFDDINVKADTLKIMQTLGIKER